MIHTNHGQGSLHIRTTEPEADLAATVLAQDPPLGDHHEPVRVDAQADCAIVRPLHVGDPQLGPFAADDRVIPAPVELERLARPEDPRHEGATLRRPLLALATDAPFAGERRHSALRSR